jgi:hypothetical protein
MSKKRKACIVKLLPAKRACLRTLAAWLAGLPAFKVDFSMYTQPGVRKRAQQEHDNDRWRI